MAGVGAVVVAVIVMLIHKLAWRAAVGGKRMKLYRFLSEDDTSAFCTK